MIDETERAWLVRYCARLSGQPESAEDMAQETLIEAWRNRHKLSDPTGRLPWLAAIARHAARWRPARAGAPSDQKVCGGCARLRSAFPGPYPQRFPAAQKAGRSSAQPGAFSLIYHQIR